MSIEKKFSPVDIRRIEDILSRLPDNEEFGITLTQLIEQWRSLTESIAEGSDWTLSTYNRGLRIRDLIEEINEALSMQGRLILQNAIEAIDTKFIDATYDPLKPESSYVPKNEVGWWQYRIPKDPYGRLQLGIPELGLEIEPPSEQSGALGPYGFPPDLPA